MAGALRIGGRICRGTGLAGRLVGALRIGGRIGRRIGRITEDLRED